MVKWLSYVVIVIRIWVACLHVARMMLFLPKMCRKMEAYAVRQPPLPMGFGTFQPVAIFLYHLVLVRACSPGEQLLTRTRIAWMLSPQLVCFQLCVCGCHLEFQLDHDGTLPRPLLELLRRPSKMGTRKQHLRHLGHKNGRKFHTDDFFWALPKNLKVAPGFPEVSRWCSWRLWFFFTKVASMFLRPVMIKGFGFGCRHCPLWHPYSGDLRGAKAASLVPLLICWSLSFSVTFSNASIFQGRESASSHLVS